MKPLKKLVALLALLALIAAACGSDDDGTGDAGTETTTITAAPDTTAAPTDTDDGGMDDGGDMEETTTTTTPPATTAPPVDTDDGRSDGPATVRWFVGLGAGADVNQIEPTQELVDTYNASQSEINLEVEFVTNDQAYGILNTQLAAGDPPDIVGPVGIRGRDGFPGAWLDLAPLISGMSYDYSDFDPGLTQFYEVPGQGTLGIPFGVAPSALFYNIDLFDEAGLAYPPENYGDPYITADGEEKPWNLDTLRELACVLTVDTNGNDCSSGNLDVNGIAQFGWANQYTDMRGLSALFGAGHLVDDNGNAVIPETYREAMKWYQELAWQDYSYPFADWGESEILGGGNWFDSGNMAMANVHLWYASCCMDHLSAAWQFAPIPEGPSGTVAKLHADTFAITKQTENPEAAFKALEWLVGPAAETLLPLYGMMPARISLQNTYFEELDTTEKFVGKNLNWDVVTQGLAYSDSPNHELGTPNFQEVQDCYNRITNKLFQDPEFDVDASFDQLLADLPGLFEGTGACTLEQ